MWEIPGERQQIEGVKNSHRGSKMSTPHLVPLSRQALATLEQVRQLTGRFDLVFAGDSKHWKPMSENTVNKALRRIGYDTKTEVCGHGFRAMACSALVESGLWSKDAVERQMSHQERNSVRAAYIHKAEYIEERRLMVQWWADYLGCNHRFYIDGTLAAEFAASEVAQFGLAPGKHVIGAKPSAACGGGGLVESEVDLKIGESVRRRLSVTPGGITVTPTAY